MDDKEDRSLRQHWGEGDVESNLSQCSECKNNKGDKVQSCAMFGEKPNNYWDNEEECPGRRV